jgi:hypothetical protein
MTPRAADSPFYSRLAQQPLQLRVFLQPHRVCVPGQEGTQVFVLGASGLLRRDGAARVKGRYRRGQGQEREQEPDRPNCIIFHNLKVSLSLSFVNGATPPPAISPPQPPAISPPQPPALKGMGGVRTAPSVALLPHLDRGHPWALTASSPKVPHTWPFPAKDRWPCQVPGRRARRVG